jgi:hypothetical protein
MKELDELNKQLENGGLSDSEASVVRTKKKLVWKRIENLKNSGHDTEPPRYITRSQTTPDVVIQLPPLPPTPKTDDSNKDSKGFLSKDFPN